MNADLEDTLRELGPDYREMVVKMRLYGTFDTATSSRAPWRILSIAAYAAAAAIALVLAITAVFTSYQNSQSFRSSQTSKTSPYVLAYSGDDAVHKIISTQRPDGSWGNDFLTRQNAAALRNMSNASVAYRKALRYLRSRGLSPLTDAELRSRAQFAQNRS